MQSCPRGALAVKQCETAAGRCDSRAEKRAGPGPSALGDMRWVRARPRCAQGGEGGGSSCRRRGPDGPGRSGRAPCCSAAGAGRGPSVPGRRLPAPARSPPGPGRAGRPRRRPGGSEPACGPADSRAALSCACPGSAVCWKAAPRPGAGVVVRSALFPGPGLLAERFRFAPCPGGSLRRRRARKVRRRFPRGISAARAAVRAWKSAGPEPPMPARRAVPRCPQSVSVPLITEWRQGRPGKAGPAG